MSNMQKKKKNNLRSRVKKRVKPNATRVSLLATQNVDDFLDDQRLEERLGGPFALKKDEELFTIDTQGDANVLKNNSQLSKKECRELLKSTEPKCFAILKPHTAVPDPISKRNRVRTKEERKSTIRKKIEHERKLKGQIQLKHKVALRNRLLSKIKRDNKPKRGEIKNDVWNEDNNVAPALKSEWFTNDTKRHILSNTAKKKKIIPNSIIKKPSVLPAVSIPHPGISYNPLYTDHQALLNKLATEEKKIIKEEKHLERVTSKMFRKVACEENENEYLEEMSEGLPLNKKENESENEEDCDLNTVSINPPVKNIKKTLVQLRKKKEQKKLKHQRIKEKIEKRKVADIYHLKQIGIQLNKKQQREALLKEKKRKIKAKKELEPKVLSRIKFEPLEQEFQLGDEISGNLRNTLPVGNLLKDRYKSLQERNLVAPGTVVMKKNKAKVKRFIKADHKIDWPTRTKK